MTIAITINVPWDFEALREADASRQDKLYNQYTVQAPDDLAQRWQASLARSEHLQQELENERIHANILYHELRALIP
jgi:hypothetical protein